MLIPHPSQIGDSSAPPPYTPSSSISAEASNLPIGSGLRGGDAQPSMTANDSGFQSAAAYLQERPCTVQYPDYILNHTLVFSPNTTRDDLPFPQPEDKYQSRDVSLEDWNTFVNYLLPIDINPANGKSRLGRPRSKDVLRDRDRIEALLAEWHEAFFGPRGIRLDARFPATSHLNVSPPPPFTSTADVRFYPEASQPTNQRAPMPPQPPMPPTPYGQSPLQWARNNLAGTRLGSGPIGRLLSSNRDQQPGPQDNFRSRRERHRHDIRERRSRSSSSSSTSSSSSSSSSGLGHEGRGAHHRGGHRGGHHGSRHHGRGRHHHGHGEHHRRRHRSLSSSSSSSSSSGSSFVSMSSSDFSGAEADEVRRSFVTLRQNLNNRAHLSTAIRQFKNEIRQSRREHREVSRGMRNISREQKSQFKTQRKEMKAELKSLIKGARAMRKADRKVRKAERKSRRAHRRAERRGMDAHALNQKAVAKAEAKALKAQRRAAQVNEDGKEKAMEAEEKARAQEDGKWNGSSRPDQDEDMMQQDLAERTRSLELNGTKKQESGVCPQNE